MEWENVTYGVEDASIRAVEVSVCKVWGCRPFADSVAGVFANVLEDICTDVPAA